MSLTLRAYLSALWQHRVAQMWKICCKGVLGKMWWCNVYWRACCTPDSLRPRLVQLHVQLPWRLLYWEGYNIISEMLTNVPRRMPRAEPFVLVFVLFNYLCQ